GGQARVDGVSALREDLGSGLGGQPVPGSDRSSHDRSVVPCPEHPWPGTVLRPWPRSGSGLSWAGNRGDVGLRRLPRTVGLPAVHRAHYLLREAMLAACIAATLASLLAWLGPPGGGVAALGFTLGLLALWAIQSGKRWHFGVLAVLTAAASPLAFLVLAICLASIGLAMLGRGQRMVVPAVVILSVAGVEVLLNRAFSDGGRYPFSTFELECVLVFCLFGAALTWRVERARTIRWFFVGYGAASLITYVVTSPLGGNIGRVRFAALPMAVLVLSLRRWRPLPVAALVMILAASWNLTPHAKSFSQGRAEPSANVSYWQPA